MSQAPLPPPPLAGTVMDSHCHLDLVAAHGGAEIEASLKLAAAAGVAKVLQVGCDVSSSVWSVQQAREYPDVWAAVALHPNEAPRIQATSGYAEVEAAWDRIDGLAADPAVRAIGETGLDFFRTEPAGREIQEESFRRHIDIAKRTGKALVVHDRQAHGDVLRVLADAGAPDIVVLHCFSGDADFAKAAVERGWFCSFAGVVTFKNAEPLRQALRVVPLELLLVETDAPFLTPAPYRGKVNNSYLVPLTVRTMADIKDVAEATLCARLWTNSRQAFGPL